MSTYLGDRSSTRMLCRTSSRLTCTSVPSGSNLVGLWRRLALEETLAKAIFAFTATRPYTESEIQRAYTEWIPQLERALTDPLGGLVGSYGRAVRDHPNANITNLEGLLENLRRASEVRNVLCHGSWTTPDASGRSIPFFLDRKMRVFDTAIDCAFLVQVQRHVAELACEVMNTVTDMGLQFPGSSGPGRPIWPA